MLAVFSLVFAATDTAFFLIAETVALSTSQGNVQHMPKHVASAGNEIILPLYVEAFLVLDLMQGKSMRSELVLHRNQTRAF